MRVEPPIAPESVVDERQQEWMLHPRQPIAQRVSPLRLLATDRSIEADMHETSGRQIDNTPVVNAETIGEKFHGCGASTGIARKPPHANEAKRLGIA